MSVLAIREVVLKALEMMSHEKICDFFCCFGYTEEVYYQSRDELLTESNYINFSSIPEYELKDLYDEIIDFINIRSIEANHVV